MTKSNMQLGHLVKIMKFFFFFLTNKQTILDTGENKNMFTETVMGTLVVQLYKPFILAVVPSLD